MAATLSDARTYGEVVRDARLNRPKPWTLQELADRAHVHLNTVWRVENEVVYPSLITQTRLAMALGVPRQVLFPQR